MKTSFAIVTDIWHVKYPVVVFHTDNPTSFSEAISKLPFKIKSVDNVKEIVEPNAYIVELEPEVY
jgi:hypothetical protein